MAGEPGVDVLRAVLERGEGHRAGREPDAGAQRADVVEVVVEALELERERASDAQVAVGPQSACLLDGVRVSHHVGHRARRAGPLDVRQRVAGLAVLGSPLEAAVLVEQAGVQREDGGSRGGHGAMM